MEHPNMPPEEQQSLQPVEQSQQEVAPPSGETEKKSKRTTILSASALVCIAVALVFYLIGNLPAFKDFFGKVVALLNPIIWGALVAYLCNPIMRFYENTLIKNVRPFHIKRMLGVVLTYVTIILIVAIFGLILIPSLVDSVKQLISNYKNDIADAVTYVNNLVCLGHTMECTCHKRIVIRSITEYHQLCTSQRIILLGILCSFLFVAI